MFFEAQKQKQKNELLEHDSFAWMIGQYVKQAIGASFNKSVTYPTEPIGTSHVDELNDEHKGKVMSDGERFAQFAISHNKTLRKRKNQEEKQNAGDKQAS